MNKNKVLRSNNIFRCIFFLLLPALLGACGGGGDNGNGGDTTPAAWQPVNNGLYGGSVTALAVNPDTPATLYAGTNGGVFKSTNGGANWAAINTGLTNQGIQDLSINPSIPTTLYAGTGGPGVFKSTTGGE